MSADVAEMLARLVSSALSADDPKTCAERVVDALTGGESGVVAALSINGLDGVPTVLADTGYPSAVIDHLTSPKFLVEDRGYQTLVLETGQKARGWRDVPAYVSSPSARSVFVPAGFAGGATARLESRNSRHVGDLHLSAHDATRPSDATVRAMSLASSSLGRILDPFATVEAVVGAVVPPGEPAVLMTATGPRSVPGRPPLPAVFDIHRLVELLVDRPLGPAGREAFTWQRDDGAVVRLHTVRVDDGVVVHAVGQGDDVPLSVREIQVLSAIVDGCSNRLIARQLGLAERTVVHHVENIFVKLAVRSRTEAALRAVSSPVTCRPRSPR